MVAHTCNLSYSGVRDWENCDLRPAWAKSSQDSILTNDWTQWSTMCHLSYMGKYKQEDLSLHWPEHKCEILSEK
jgi:hypothetical protein